MDRLIHDITGGNIHLDLYENLVFPRPDKLEEHTEKIDVEEDYSPKIRFPLKWTKLNYPPVRSIDDQRTISTFDIINDKFFVPFCTKLHNGTKMLMLNGNVLFSKIGRRVHDSDVPHLLNFLKKNVDVTSISLAYNRLGNDAFKEILHHVLVINNVIEVNLQNNEISARGMDYLLEVAEKLPLKSLRLNGNKIGVEGSKEIAIMLLKNSRLEHLDVGETDQNASSLVYFTTVLRSDQEVYNNTLRILDISRPNLGHSFDTADIATSIGNALKHNTCLRELHLQKYGFNCHDIERMVTDAKCNNTLEVLDLGCNNIGDHGVDQLGAWLIMRPALRSLVLSRNIVTDHGARSLGQSIPFSKLILLDVSYNKISDDGMASILNTIKKTPPLVYLRIFGNNIGQPTANIIHQILASQVLNQTDVDVRPYIIDYEWYIAYYPSDDYKQRYYDLPLYSSSSEKPEQKSNVKSVDARLHRKSRTQDFTICKSDVQIEEGRTNSLYSNAVIPNNINGCTRCFDEVRKSLVRMADDEQDAASSASDKERSIHCNCSKCIQEECRDSRSTSLNTRVSERNEFEFDATGKIPSILKRVNSNTRQNILRWINMDESALEEDLKEQEAQLTPSSCEYKKSFDFTWMRFFLPSAMQENVSSFCYEGIKTGNHE